MVVFLNIAILLLLLIIAYEDFRVRAIHTFLPILLFACLVTKYYTAAYHIDYIQTIGINIAFLLMQVFLAMIFFTVREKQLVNIFKSYLGTGDVLFLLSISPAFSTINFVAFYTVSLAIIATLYFVAGTIKWVNSNHQIPLAGLQAILFILASCAEFYSQQFSLGKDWITPYY